MGYRFPAALTLAAAMFLAGPAASDPCGCLPFPEIDIDIGPDLNQISIPIGCESNSFQSVPAGSHAFQRNIQVGEKNVNIQVVEGVNVQQFSQQISPPEGDLPCGE